MSECVNSMLELVASGGYRSVEDEWMAALADPEFSPHDLVPVLEALVEAGHADTAEVLAWTAVGEVEDRLEADELLALLKAIYMALGRSEEIRGQLIAQYKAVYRADEDIDRLAEACGLSSGEKSPRMALRTLDLCLHARPGSYLLSRRDDTVARVREVSADQASYTVEFGGRPHIHSADELASEFSPTAEDDYRVLTQFRRERLAEMLEQEPGALVEGIVKTRTGTYTADDLRFELCPRYLPNDQWTKWWTRARNALKKNPRVRLEGRSPVTLVYEAQGWTVEQESWALFAQADSGSKVYAAVEAYFREARGRNKKPNPEHLTKLAVEIERRMPRARRDAPSEALTLALVRDSLLERGARPTGDESVTAKQMLAEADDPLALLRSLTESRLWGAALDAAHAGLPESWVEMFARLLPLAPMGACAAIAQRIRAAGREDLLAEAVVRIFDDPAEHMDALGWIWKGSPSLAGVPTPTPLEMLHKMLGTLAEVSREGSGLNERGKHVRDAVKSALSAGGRKTFQACLAEMDESMASAIRTQIGRLHVLGPALREDLHEEIRKRFYRLWARPKVDPWKDENTIYCTGAGVAALQKDIDHLINVEMVENAKAIGAAAEHGDLSENAEYKFALEARDMLRARLANMQRHLSIHRIIEPEEVPTEHVGIGSRVTLRRASDGTTTTIVFVGPWEADIHAGRYNYQAPISQELMGRGVGDAVHLALDEHEDDWTVESIERGL